MMGTILFVVDIIARLTLIAILLPFAIVYFTVQILWNEFRSLSLILPLLLMGCNEPKPVWIWYNNTCTNQWIEYEDGFHKSSPEGAAFASPLTVPCTATYQLGDTGLVWTKVPWRD